MTLAAGTRLGPYEILAPLGAGGMGEVYRARDTRLGREVAVKVLPAELSGNPGRLARFEQEARAASGLNHPNIVVVYDIGRTDTTAYIAMELVSGQSLRDLMAAGPLSVRRILPIASQVSEGLARAHAAGIVHRDLKPENVMVTDDGFVKILDFGLAKAAAPEESRLTSEPTAVMATPRTETGVVLGTVGYMSPEQAAGRVVDHRSDQFSLGSVLYEMATGRRAFQKDSTAQTLAAIIEQDPEPITTVRPDVPAPFAWVVERCHAKSPAERYESTRDLARDLATLPGRISGANPLVSGQTARRPAPAAAIGWLAAGLMLIALLASLLRQPPGAKTAESGAIRFSIPPPEGSSFHSGEILTKTAMSPDGRSLALVAFSGGRPRLYVRPLDSATPRVLAGTEDAQSPFWSPDSRFVGFVAAGKLKKVDVVGGPPQAICDVSFEGTGTWSRNGDILFAEAAPGREGIHRASAGGGERSRVTVPDANRKERYHFWPHFLPDGRHFLYLAVGLGDGGVHDLRIGSLDSGESTSLGRIDSRTEYVSPGFLLFAREGSLLARPFDAKSRRWTGEPREIADRLHYFYGPATAGFSASQNGVLAYEQGRDPSRLVWLGRDGKEISTVGSFESADDVRLSPEGKRVAVSIRDPRTGTSDVWIYDLSRKIPTRLTAEPFHDSMPVWAPGGDRIIFRSDRNGPPDLFEVSTTGGAATLFLERPGPQQPEDFSPDGAAFLFAESDRATGGDLWLFPFSIEGKPGKTVPLLRTRFTEDAPRFSPEGRWIAYDSDESGASEVYVARRDGTARVRISTDGGFSPRWRRDGAELFYLAPGRRVMAISVKTSGVFEPGDPAELFRVEPAIFDYDVAADGSRFLVSEATGPPRPPIAIVVNWPATLKESKPPSDR